MPARNFAGPDRRADARYVGRVRASTYVASGEDAAGEAGERNDANGA
jgi:hypothetical protein